METAKISVEILQHPHIRKRRKERRMNERKIPVNVIFIDIDGVLNCESDLHDDSSRPYLNVELVRRFEEFCDLFEPLIVLTSSWREVRESPDPASVTGRLRSLEEVNEWFTSLKIPMRRIRDMTDPTTISWNTEEEYAFARAGEIQRWIIKKSEAYPDVCFNWIAFDDMRLPLEDVHFVHVAGKTGLTVDSVNEGAKKLLSIIAVGDKHQPVHRHNIVGLLDGSRPPSKAFKWLTRWYPTMVV